MLGMLDLEITVLSLFTLNFTLSDGHIGVPCLHIFIYSLQHEISIIGLKTRVCGLYHLAFAVQEIRLSDGNFYLYKLQIFGISSLATTQKLLLNVCKYNSFHLNNDTCKTNSDSSCLFEHSYLESWNSSIDLKYFYLFVCSLKHRTQK